ncbi:MAG: anti-sigma factor family protein [Candidatus Dormibacteria bacterium]
MNSSCGERRIALGAYVLGALDPEERAEVEGHLAGCVDCRGELAALAQLTPTLGRVPRTEWLAAATAAAPAPARPSLVARTLAELARQRRRRRLRLRLVMATGAVAVVALGAAVGVLVATRPAPAAPAAVVAARLSGSDPGTGVSASAELYAEPWGTSIRLDVSGVTPGDQCQLVAVAQDGSEQVAGTWKVGYTGGVDIVGATGIGAGRLAALQVVTTSGVDLVDLRS